MHLLYADALRLLRRASGCPSVVRQLPYDVLSHLHNSLLRISAGGLIAAGGAEGTAAVPIDLPVIVGQHVTHPDGTIAGAIESESSSSSSSASCCSDCSEQRCCLETET